VQLGRSCRGVVVDAGIARVLEGLEIRIPAMASAGRETSLAVTGPGIAAAREFLWDFGDGTRGRSDRPSVSHAFERPGRFRLGVQVFARRAAGIASRTLCVLPAGRPLAGCADAAGWRLAGEGMTSLEVDGSRSVTGTACLCATVRGGTLSVLRREFPAMLDLGGAAGISFFYRYACDLSILCGARTRTVGLRLVTANGERHEFIPDVEFKGEPSEDRYDWVYFAAPRESLSIGPDLGPVAALEVVFGPAAPADCIFRLDGLVAW
jgi:hypothetical protein